MITINTIIHKLIKLCQQHKIVYHGSGQTSLTTIDAFEPEYEGGIGSGVYCAFERDVAKFYSHGGSVYVLELLLNDNEILYLSPEDNIGFFDVELDSMLIGENLRPFMFSINNDTYYVCDDYSFQEIINNEIFQYIQKNNKQLLSIINEEKMEIDDDKLYNLAEIKLKESLPESQKQQLEQLNDKFYNNRNKQLSWDNWLLSKPELLKNFEQSINEECDNLYGILKEQLDNIITIIENKYDKNKQIELDDIGNIAQQHGFKAVYVEGIRGNHPDSELLVFDPKHLKYIREEKP